MATIVIDPGHGGTDNHNRGISGRYYEHIGNLEFAIKLRDVLKDHFTVILTRENDSSLSLSERARIAIRNRALLFISIHSNASSSSSAGGTSVYYSINRPRDEAFAKAVGQATAAAYGINFRGAKTRASTRRSGFDYYTVIDVSANYKKLSGNSSAYEVPHVLLVERAFHTNPREEELLLDPSVSQRAARAMGEAIIKYLEGESSGDNIMLKKGSVGPDVRKLQQDLTTLGYGSYLEPWGVDGIFGSATERAVIAFQNDQGLDQDGIAGPITLGRIKELLANQPPQNGDTPVQDNGLQERIAALERQVQGIVEELDNIKKVSSANEAKINELYEILEEHGITDFTP